MNTYLTVKNNFIMTNANADWTSYRNELTDMILRDNPDSVMIIGGGRCNDINLERLANEIQEIIILDIDETAMNEAVSVVSSELQDKITCKTASLTGISEDDLCTFMDNMLVVARDAARLSDSEYYHNMLIKELDIMFKKLISNESELSEILPHRFVDTVVCSGVYSQLFSMLMYYVRSLAANLNNILPDVDMTVNEIANLIRITDDKLIPIINDAIIHAAKRTVIFANEYMPDNPVEGAHQCIADLKERIKPEEHHINWDFNRASNITYDMLIQICRI